MNEIQVECFLETVRFKSYTKAAEQLFLSQPTVSRYVSGLEACLGCKLLRRTTKNVELTREGELYYRMFSAWKLELENIKKEIAEISEINTYKIRIGYLEGWVIPPALTDFCVNFQEQYPEIQIEFICLGFHELMEALVKNAADIVLVLENPCFMTSDFQYRKVTEIKKGIIYSKNHPLAHKGKKSLEDLKNEIFYVLADDDQYAVQYTKDLCARYNFIPRIQEVENIQTIHVNVQSGAGVTINDEWGPGCYRDYFDILYIDEFSRIYLVWGTKNIKKEVKLLIDKFEI